MGEEECFCPAKWLFTKTYQIGCRFPTLNRSNPLQDTEGHVNFQGLFYLEKYVRQKLGYF